MMGLLGSFKEPSSIAFSVLANFRDSLFGFFMINHPWSRSLFAKPIFRISIPFNAFPIAFVRTKLSLFGWLIFKFSKANQAFINHKQLYHKGLSYGNVF